MLRRRSIAGCVVLGAAISFAAFAQRPPSASSARVLLLPKQVVSGERATLAVLDVLGRLTPGVTVNFSNGDRLSTDPTGRALFVAPLNPGVIFASLAQHSARAHTTILTPAEATSSALEVASAPRFASLTDRFELSGRGFCGDADANQVRIGGRTALVLASSPLSLLVLPPSDLEPGRQLVDITCAKRTRAPFTVTFVSLSLEADSSPLAPGGQRALTVRVHGTTSKVGLEAHNLAPEVADLTGGNPALISSTGGADNVGHFQLVGRQRGSFVISVRLLPSAGVPRP